MTCDTIKVFTLKSSVKRCIGRSDATDPSTNRIGYELGSYYIMLPSSNFYMRSTQANMPGIAQEAQTADQTHTVGVVR